MEGDEVLEKYREWLMLKGYSPHTAKNWRSYVSNILRHCDINKEEEVMDYLWKRFRKGTRSRYKMAYNRFMEFLEEGSG